MLSTRIRTAALRILRSSRPAAANSIAVRFIASSSSSAQVFRPTKSARMPADATSKDDYTKATLKEADPQTKVAEIQKIIKDAGVCMLTTKTANGDLHSRAMAPASKEAPHVFCFVANSESGKFDEIEHSEDSKVNVSIYDKSSTNWVSVAGNVKINTDKARIHEVFSPATAAWFGDLKDGVHDGTADDPRVQLIEVIPYEIRYWYQTQTTVGALANIATSAVTGKVANPGYLRSLTKAELEQTK